MSEQLEAKLAADCTVAFSVAHEQTGREKSRGEAIADLEIRMDMTGIEPGDINTLHLHVMTDDRQPAKCQQRTLISQIASDIIR